MATSFPSGLDALTNPTSSDGLNSPDHAGQHADVNDAIEALEAKVGVNGSAVTSSLDYMVAASKVVTDKVDPASASTNQVLKFNGTKFVPATGASVTVSDTPPTSPTPQAGDQWYESDTGRQLIYYDGFWVEIGSTATTNVNAADLSGTVLASNVVSSSLTSVGTLSSGAVPTTLLTGTTLPASVVSSSLTSVGTLGSLAVTGDITRGGVSMPRGIMGRAVRDNVFGLTTTLTDVGISVTFNAVAGRYYKYTAYNYASDSTAGLIETNITDSANTYKSGALMRCDGPGSYVAIINQWVSTEPAGSITVKLRAKCSTGTGSMYGPIWLTVEDIGVF